MIARWFNELEHYGFIVLHRHGSLGVDGKGKSPHWRLTELGVTGNASSGGNLEPPTSDFLRWDGTLPGSHGSPPWRTGSKMAHTGRRLKPEVAHTGSP